jgi:hypothetical protein
MFRPIALATASLLAASAAAGTTLTVRSDDVRLAPAAATAGVAACRLGRPERARIFFTVRDPQGIDYFAVRLGTDAVRPVLSDHQEAYLWVAPDLRGIGVYQWRFEDEGRLSTERTMPVHVNLVETPLNAIVQVKDGSGVIVETAIRLAATARSCSG